MAYVRVVHHSQHPQNKANENVIIMENNPSKTKENSGK